MNTSEDTTAEASQPSALRELLLTVEYLRRALTLRRETKD